MTLSAGGRLGPYTIGSAIGRGGMGEVFRAHDARLNRDVAIKVLPEAFASDPDRLARFEREAQVLASLNHPNIAHVHGLEEGQGVRGLVMELVEGRMLAEVIKAAGARGLPIGDALPIARQIAEALDVAHEKGIVHRDLKPANILVTADGTVKVLDFGLAKAMAPADAAIATDVMNSPTYTGRATEVGVILGTAAYMAPEQAKGLAVDRRADIWAFGAVLFEMLSGHRAFDGNTSVDIVAAVVTKEPEWSRLPAGIPESVTHLLHRCLEKDPKRRMRDIGDARAELEVVSPSPPVPQATKSQPAARRRPWIPIAGITICLAAGIALGRQFLAPRPSPPNPVKFEIVVKDRTLPVISPDGTKLVLTSAKGLFVRDLDTLNVRELVGTEGAQTPFWSNDSSAIVYGARGSLWRVMAAGGAPSLLVSRLPTEAWDQDAGGAFTSDGGIVFTNGSSALMRVPSAGGEATTFIDINPAEELHFHNVSALPDDRGFLFVTHRKAAYDTIELAAGGKRQRLLRIEGALLSYPVYSPSGHILYTRFPTSAGLWAVPFSLSTLSVTGEPFLVDAAASKASISRTMRLAYVPRADLAPSRLTWLDRSGKEVGRVEELHVIDRFVALSPDGTRVAFSERTDDKLDVWTHTFKTGEHRRLTVDGFSRWPVWTPDGRSIVYASVLPTGESTIKRVAADGSGPLGDVGPGREHGVSRDGRFLTYARDFDLFYRPLEGGDEVPLVKSPLREQLPRISPDGRFLLFLEREPKAFTPIAHVKPFPTGGPAVPLGFATLNYAWSGDGKKVYYTVPPDVFEVDVQTTPGIRAGIPRKLFSLRELGTSGLFPSFDVTPDGQRFLTLVPDPEALIQRVVVVLGFNPKST
jgi:serine/threonine protein kinase/Tol biopolymer transport system component